MERNIRVTVASVIEDAGHFLLVEENIAGQILYNQPAGHLEPGESLAQAVARETLEETAWQFVPQAILGLYQYTNPQNHITYLRVCFSGQHHGHDPNRVLDDGILRAIWLSYAEIAGLQKQHRSPMVMRCLDDYLAGTRYPLHLIHHLDLP